MHGSGNHKRRRCHNSLSSHLADDVTTIVTPVSGWRRAMGRSKLQQRYYDPNVSEFMAALLLCEE